MKGKHILAGAAVFTVMAGMGYVYAVKTGALGQAAAGMAQAPAAASTIPPQPAPAATPTVAMSADLAAQFQTGAMAQDAAAAIAAAAAVPVAAVAPSGAPASATLGESLDAGPTAAVAVGPGVNDNLNGAVDVPPDAGATLAAAVTLTGEANQLILEPEPAPVFAAASTVADNTVRVAAIETSVLALTVKVGDLVERVDGLVRGRAGPDADHGAAAKPEALAPAPKSANQIAKAPAWREDISTLAKIRSVQIHTTGDPGRVRAVFELAGGARPKLRMFNNAEQGWVAIDLYDTHLSGAEPAPAGFVVKTAHGIHKGFRRFVFSLAGDAPMFGEVEQSAGEVVLYLMDGPSYRAYRDSGRLLTAAAPGIRTPAPDGLPATASAVADAGVTGWMVRAISGDAAVLYELSSGRLISVLEGSAVPSLGVVTGFVPAERRVLTTHGEITPQGVVHR